MKKKLYRDMAIIIFSTAILLVVVFGLLFYSRFAGQMKEGLKTLRVTIISETGEVIYDNKKAGLANHSDRPEVIEAIEKGFGESERYSDSLGQKTYYYAFKISDSQILRLSVTGSSVALWLYQLLPLLLLGLFCVLALSLLLAKRLTERLVKPINTIDLDQAASLPYEELSPFMKRIEAQKNEIKAQLSTLESRANTIKTITENMKEGLLLVDENGLILSYNKTIEQIFGHERVSSKNLLHLNRNIEFFDKVKEAIGGQRCEMTYQSGSQVYSVFFSPAAYEMKIKGAIILFLDITDRFLAEKQRKEFSANVSHELKTPLTTISALAEMIESEIAKPEDIKGFAEKIHAQATRLIDLINDIIKLSEFDERQNNSAFKKESFDLSQVARSVGDSLAHLADSKEVSLQIQGDNVSLHANPRMIEELLFNLIDNGIKYNRSGGKVLVDLSNEKGLVKISVSDTGIGIGQEHLGRIFERFYRVDPSRSKRTGGTGLGLSIVKHIVELHNGKIEIDSVENQGTRIVCSFEMTDPNQR